MKIINKASKADCAWLAGFYEGEGSITRTTNVCGRRIPEYNLSIGQVNREPLDRIVELFGVGRIYGPYTLNRKQPFHQYRTNSFKDTQVLVCAMWPFLSKRRKKDWTDAAKKYFSYPKKIRLNEDDVRYIRSSKLSNKDLATKFRLHPKYISKVRNKDVWINII